MPKRNPRTTENIETWNSADGIGSKTYIAPKTYVHIIKLNEEHITEIEINMKKNSSRGGLISIFAGAG